jgi:hypothetical protein
MDLESDTFDYHSKDTVKECVEIYYNCLIRGDEKYLIEHGCIFPEVFFKVNNQSTNIIMEIINLDKLNLLKTIFDVRVKKYYETDYISYAISKDKYDIADYLICKCFIDPKNIIFNYKNEKACILFEKLKEDYKHYFIENNGDDFNEIYFSKGKDLILNNFSGDLYLLSLKTLKKCEGYVMDNRNQIIYGAERCQICFCKNKISIYENTCNHSICYDCFIKKSGTSPFNCCSCRKVYTVESKYTLYSNIINIDPTQYANYKSSEHLDPPQNTESNGDMINYIRSIIYGNDSH